MFSNSDVIDSMSGRWAECYRGYAPVRQVADEMPPTRCVTAAVVQPYKEIAATTAFLTALMAPYDGMTGLNLEVRLIQGNRITVRVFPFGRMADAVACIQRYRSTHNCYAGVLPRSRVPAPCKGCLDADVLVAAWLWADIDAGNAMKPEVFDFVGRVKERIPQPSMVVESGSGGIHLYWRLAAPVTLAGASRERLRRVLRRIVTLIGGNPMAVHADMTCTNVGRIMRAPGTHNFKHDPPRPVRLAVCANGDVLTFNEWRQLLPHEPLPERTLTTPRKPQGANTRPIGQIPGRLLAWSQNGYPEGERHRGLVGAAAYLRRSTDLNDDYARELFDAKARSSVGTHPLTDNELDNIWNWAG